MPLRRLPAGEAGSRPGAASERCHRRTGQPRRACPGFRDMDTPACQSQILMGETMMNGQLLIPQSYVGRVNVVGECYCLGVVGDRRPPTYKNIPTYLNFTG